MPSRRRANRAEVTRESRHVYSAKNCLVGGFAGVWATTDEPCPPCEDLRLAMDRLRSRLKKENA